MTVVAEKRVVSIQYTLTNPEGETIDASEPGDPLRYLHGAGNIVPGLERELEGKKVGDELQVVVTPEGAEETSVGETLPLSLVTSSPVSM